MKKGSLVVISGFSGAGKGTVIAELMRRESGYGFSVSATTRYKREGEEHGVHYFFISKEEFEEGIAAGRFLEYTQYSGNYYGTLADYVYARMDDGITILLDIECEGALNVKRLAPEARLIYIIPPSAEVLLQRLTGRGTETREQIKKRLTRAVEEADIVSSYDGILVNDDLGEAVSNLSRMIRDEEYRRASREENLPLVLQIRDDLKQMLSCWQDEQ